MERNDYNLYPCIHVGSSEHTSQPNPKRASQLSLVHVVRWCTLKQTAPVIKGALVGHSVVSSWQAGRNTRAFLPTSTILEWGQRRSKWKGDGGGYWGHNWTKTGMGRSGLGKGQAQWKQWLLKPNFLPWPNSAVQVHVDLCQLFS